MTRAKGPAGYDFGQFAHIRDPFKRMFLQTTFEVLRKMAEDHVQSIDNGQVQGERISPLLEEITHNGTDGKMTREEVGR